jgi:hypothetical protein
MNQTTILVLNSKGGTMKKLTLLIIIAISYLTVFGFVKANAASTMFYILPKDTVVLGFLGNPHRLDWKPVRLISYEDQSILLFHKKSGRGIWAFYVRGFSYLDKDGSKKFVSSDGFFTVKRKDIKR